MEIRSRRTGGRRDESVRRRAVQFASRRPRECVRERAFGVLAEIRRRLVAHLSSQARSARRPAVRPDLNGTGQTLAMGVGQRRMRDSLALVVRTRCQAIPTGRGKPVVGEPWGAFETTDRT